MLEIAELFVLGIGVGTFGALVGLGGGLIMVPLFTLLMMPPARPFRRCSRLWAPASLVCS